MGVFFQRASIGEVVAPALAEALATDPATVEDKAQVTAQRVTQVVQQTRGIFSWVRLLVALLLLGGLLVAAIYTGRDSALQNLYTVLVHGLEVGLGGVLGLLVGEASA